MFHGAFVVLHCRDSKHFVRKREVIIGRSSDGLYLNVDIDLGKYNYRSKISRRQEIERGVTVIYGCGGKRIKLGSHGFEVLVQGLGCMGLTGHYGAFDTSVMYGPETKEVLLGKDGVREKMALATKFGISSVEGKRGIKGDPAYVRAAYEASFKRLDVACIDLYYQHRVDTLMSLSKSL